MRKPLSRPIQILFYGLGFVSLALGFIGIFLPIMPTVPFLLLAAYFFSRSSERMNQWLLNHKTFGPSIRAWQERGEVSRSSKVMATLVLIGSATFVTFFRAVPLWTKILLYGTFCAVLLFLWTRPETHSPRGA